MRGCQWKKLSNHVKKRSPYSVFYYTPLISTPMILQAVRNGKFFGLLEVDIYTPNHIKKEFNKINFATIFDKIVPAREMLSENIQQICDNYERKFPLNPQLTLVYEASNYLVTSEMLRYYMAIGLVVTNVHCCVEYQKSKPLRKFIDLSKGFSQVQMVITIYLVTNKRIEATISNDDAMQGCYKLVGNSCYGRLGMNLTKHLHVTYRTLNGLSKGVRSPLYVRHEPISAENSCEIFELVKRKRSIVDCIPISSAFFILSNAKLHVLRFVNDIRTTLNTDALRLLYMGKKIIFKF